MTIFWNWLASLDDVEWDLNEQGFTIIHGAGISPLVPISLLKQTVPREWPFGFGAAFTG
jgi:hypothetical protein